jgi:hypothetical protein
VPVQAETWISSASIHRAWPGQKPRNRSPGKELDDSKADKGWGLAPPICVVDTKSDRDTQNDAGNDQQNQTKCESEC